MLVPRAVGMVHGTFFPLGCLVILVTCQPPAGCDIGIMTAWTFGLSWGCLSRSTIVSLAGLGHWVWTCCAVASDCSCDCLVACERSCPNTYKWVSPKMNLKRWSGMFNAPKRLNWKLLTCKLILSA